MATLGITDDDTVYEDCSFIMQPQASMVIMDQTTGEVVAMIGGRGEKTANKTLNRASDSLRNPGSTFKIVAAYAPLLRNWVMDRELYYMMDRMHIPVRIADW